MNVCVKYDAYISSVKIYCNVTIMHNSSKEEVIDLQEMLSLAKQNCAMKSCTSILTRAMMK